MSKEKKNPAGNPRYQGTVNPPALSGGAELEALMNEEVICGPYWASNHWECPYCQTRYKEGDHYYNYNKLCSVEERTWSWSCTKDICINTALLRSL